MASWTFKELEIHFQATTKKVSGSCLKNRKGRKKFETYFTSYTRKFFLMTKINFTFVSITKIVAIQQGNGIVCLNCKSSF